jgi:hypothetical protein
MLKHEEAKHAVDRVYEPIPVFVVFMAEPLNFIAQVAFDASIGLRYQPIFCILDGLLPGSLLLIILSIGRENIQL